MSLSHFNQIADYLAFLREHPDEVKQLFRDLLISVTNFFRDPEAFQALETEVIVPLVRAKEPDAPLRVWSAGCATGEEPYSLGILLLEQLAAAQKNCRLQIFATDVDEDALEVARQGVYPESIAADVSPERLGRFFTHLDDSFYQVSKQLREIVTLCPPEPDHRRALLQTRSHRLPQPADLSGAGSPEEGHRAPAFLSQRGRLSLPGPVGDDWPAHRPVRAGFQEMAHFPAHRPDAAAIASRFRSPPPWMPLAPRSA